MQFKRDLTQNSNKLSLDKYFTSDETAQHCIDVVMNVLKNEEITESIEPSAGNGAFSKKIKNCIAYDIEPEDSSIIEQDFLKLQIPYKRGRLFIGNPPFGRGNNLLVSFFKKCVSLGDYIAFILPVSQLNNSSQLYDFDLIYSEDLGKRKYTDRELHCCFNVYKRPIFLNKKPNITLKSVEIIEIRNRKGTANRNINIDDYDISICSRGNGTVGKILKISGKYNMELHIKILNGDYKDKIIALIKETNWKDECKSISSKYISKTMLYKYIMKIFPELK